MDYLDNDTTHLILQQVPVLDRLQLHKVLNIPKPSQFQVSSELMASKDFRGDNGLIMRAITTGEYEVCVQATMIFYKRYLKHEDKPENIKIYEDFVRSEFNDYCRFDCSDMVSLELYNDSEFRWRINVLNDSYFSRGR